MSGKTKTINKTMCSKNKRNFHNDFVKAIKKNMREEFGLMPTKVQKSKKTYNRNKYKNFNEDE